MPEAQSRAGWLMLEVAAVVDEADEPDQSPVTYGRTARAAAMAARRGDDQLIVPAELVDTRFRQACGNAFDLVDLRTLLLLIGASNPDLGTKGPHEALLVDLHKRKTDHGRLTATLHELATARFGEGAGEPLFDRLETHDKASNPLLDDGGARCVRWSWSASAVSLFQASEIFAELKGAVVHDLSSAYALRIYMRASLYWQRSKPVWRGTPDELRQWLDVPGGAYPSIVPLLRYAVKEPIAKIHELTSFRVDVETIAGRGRGKKIKAVELRFSQPGVSPRSQKASKSAASEQSPPGVQVQYTRSELDAALKAVWQEVLGDKGVTFNEVMDAFEKKLATPRNGALRQHLPEIPPRELIERFRGWCLKYILPSRIVPEEKTPFTPIDGEDKLVATIRGVAWDWLGPDMYEQCFAGLRYKYEENFLYCWADDPKQFEFAFDQIRDRASAALPSKRPRIRFVSCSPAEDKYTPFGSI